LIVSVWHACGYNFQDVDRNIAQCSASWSGLRAAYSAAFALWWIEFCIKKKIQSPYLSFSM